MRLARIAGTTQAAISRLEAGTGIVPLALLARVAPALAANVVDATLMTAEGERFLAALQTLGASGLERSLAVTRDPEVDELIQRCLRAPAAERRVLLAVARVLDADVARHGR